MKKLFAIYALMIIATLGFSQTEALKKTFPPVNECTQDVDFTGTVEFDGVEIHGTDLTAIGLNSTHRTTVTGNPHVVTKAEVGLSEVENIKVNYSASTNPGASDDSGSGYAVGSKWVNITLDRAYECMDATAANAVWKLTSKGADLTKQAWVDPTNGHNTNAVVGSDTNPFLTVQAAITAVEATITTELGIIRIGSGSYSESLTVASAKNIILVSDGGAIITGTLTNAGYMIFSGTDIEDCVLAGAGTFWIGNGSLYTETASQTHTATGSLIFSAGGGLDLQVATNLSTFATITSRLGNIEGFSNLTGTITGVYYDVDSDKIRGIAATATNSDEAVSKAHLDNNFAGSANIVTLGTIGTGIWNGTAIPNTYGGTGQDSSAWTGYPHIATGTWGFHKSNIGASVGPTVNDDVDLGYVIGSIWIDTTADKQYICLDNTDGAAIWTETTAGAAGGEANTYSNAGAGGVGIILAKAGVDLPFKSVNAGSSMITITNDAGNSEVDIDAVPDKILEGTITGNGLLTRIALETFQERSIAGTADEISVVNGDGVAGNPTIGLADNPIMPGTEGIQMAGGTQAQRPGTPVEGDLRKNTDGNNLEYYTGSAWVSCTAGAAGGEANTASNVGTSGVGIFKQKAGVDLELYKVLGSTGISWALNGTDYIDVKVDISPLAAEATPVDADLFIMERVSDGAIVKVLASNLPGSGGGLSGDPARLGEIQQIAASAASVYTNPASTVAEIQNIIIHNVNTTTEVVTIWIVPDSGGALGTAADANKAFRISVASNETVNFDFEQVGIVLTDTNDSIQMSTTTVSKVTAQLMGATGSDNDRLTEIVQIASSAGAVYTNASSTTAKINTIIIHNTNTTTEVVTLWNVPDSGGSLGTAADANKFYRMSVASNETVILDYGKYGIVLTDTNDSIQCSTTTASKMNITIYGDK